MTDTGVDEYGLLEPGPTDTPGDEWEELDVSDTEADKIARERDREFDEFRKRIDNTEGLKVEASVFDDATYAALYKLVQDGYVDALGGPVSTGKEANVYVALGGAHARDEFDAAGDTEVAIKIYRINASNFQDMREYLVGDPRFGELSDKKEIVLAWTRKELANLKRARAAGVRVPQPLDVERNVLVMEFLGTDGKRAKRLTEVDIENARTAFEVLREYMRRLYAAGLVHGDLSEYNVLFDRGELVVIDVGQAITIHHPNVDDFLARDCENVATFFARQGLDVTGSDLEAWIRDHADPTD
jgi:RIO kinase 1